jgi:hypothetical protein
MICCKNDLGTFPHNRDINTGIETTQAGIHEIRLKGPNFATQSLFQNLDSGDEIVIPKGVLNEYFQYSMVIIQPDLTMIELTECSNFTFKTFINRISCEDESYL